MRTMKTFSTMLLVSVSSIALADDPAIEGNTNAQFGGEVSAIAEAAKRRRLPRASYRGLLTQLRNLVARLQPADTGKTVWEDWVAVGLNDKIAAIAPTYEKGKEPFHLRAMIPPDALADGRNKLEAFLIHGNERHPVLVPVHIPEPETYRLARDGSAEIIYAASGKGYRLEQNAARGFLDRLTQHGTILELRGWAVDAKAGAIPESVMVQVDGGELHAAELRISRPDVAQALSNDRYELSGFSVFIPDIDNSDVIRSVRIFMLSKNGHAGELSVDPSMLEALGNDGG